MWWRTQSGKEGRSERETDAEDEERRWMISMARRGHVVSYIAQEPGTRTRLLGGKDLRLLRRWAITFPTHGEEIELRGFYPSLCGPETGLC